MLNPKLMVWVWVCVTKGFYLLSCMHRPVQPKSLSWWGEVGNSLIFQHSPSRGGSFRPQTWNRSEPQLFFLIALTRIRTRDLWLWYYIELHAPTSSTRKLKLMGRGGHHLYSNTLASHKQCWRGWCHWTVLVLGKLAPPAAEASLHWGSEDQCRQERCSRNPGHRTSQAVQSPWTSHFHSPQPVQRSARTVPLKLGSASCENV